MTLIYLSHVLDVSTPAYGDSRSLEIENLRSIARGHSCNESAVRLPLHLGSHADSPFHFDEHGPTIDHYEPDFWFVRSVSLIDVPAGPGDVVDLDRFEDVSPCIPRDCEAILIRTGAERLRWSEPETYATNGPYLGDDLARHLRENFDIRFLGVDSISISSPAHRDVGRSSHRDLLCLGSKAPVVVLEDLSLGGLQESPKEMWIFPLRIRGADGAPITVVARL